MKNEKMTHRRWHTQKMTHTEDDTHRRWHTQKMTHTEDDTHRWHTQKMTHTDDTHRRWHTEDDTQKMTHRRWHTEDDTQKHKIINWGEKALLQKQSNVKQERRQCERLGYLFRNAVQVWRKMYLTSKGRQRLRPMMHHRKMVFIKAISKQWLLMTLSKHCNLSKPLSVPALFSDHNPVFFKIILRLSIFEARTICDYTHPARPLYLSTLDQQIAINPRIRDHTYLEHTIQKFSSAVRHARSSHSPTHRPVPSSRPSS